MAGPFFAAPEKRSVSWASGSWRPAGGRGWLAADRADERRPPPLGAVTPQLGHDFSRISVHAPSARGMALTTTIPFAAVIRASAGGHRGGAARLGKTVHDEVAGRLGQREPEQPAGGSERKPVAPVERDENTLYIAQMGGLPAMKDTSGVADSVSATFTYLPASSRGGVTLGAGDFGDTEGSLKHFSSVVITAAAGKFTVTADLKQTVHWETRADKGPTGQVNITSETDPGLNSGNYTQAVTDLTPDTSDLKGRPPRTKFWSKDLTEQHEQYHVKDYVDVARTGAADAEKWLAGQSAAKKEDVPALLDTAWKDQVHDPWDKFTDPPGVEERAYSDGAPSYKARADAIKAKGDKGAAGGYPAPP
jgi:hypothetical protein